VEVILEGSDRIPIGIRQQCRVPIMVVMEVELPIITFSGGRVGHGEYPALGIGGEILGQGSLSIHCLGGFFKSMETPGIGPDGLGDAVNQVGTGSQSTESVNNFV